MVADLLISIHHCSQTGGGGVEGLAGREQTSQEAEGKSPQGEVYRTLVRNTLL